LAAIALLLAASSAGAQEELVAVAMWGDGAARVRAMGELARGQWSQDQIRKGEEVIRRGRDYPAVESETESVRVVVGPMQFLTVNVQLPPNYDPKRAYPLMLVIGGGPPGSVEAAERAAARMMRLWSEPARAAGWFVATVVDTVSVAKSQRPLRYDVLHADCARSIFHELQAHFHIDAGRIHSTGVSLGSNYSLAYAEAMPHRFAGVVPVSTEGESREWALRNLKHVGVYILEGVNDRNIRAIEGPRKLNEILTRFGYARVYDEHADRGHEAFEEKYPAVLEWLAARPRDPWPRQVLRVAHPGIMMPEKRFYWIEADTHQAIFRASVVDNTISVDAARARRLTFHLSDRLVNLDEPVRIRVNGEQVFEEKVNRSILVAIDDALRLGDTERFATAVVTVDVPRLDRGEAFVATLEPEIEPGALAFWEQYAMETLEAERPGLPAELEMVAAGDVVGEGFMAAYVARTPEGSELKAGDLILEYNREPFFAGVDGLDFMRRFILRSRDETFDLKIRRDGEIEHVSMEWNWN
jgi:hypothetical protein